MKIMLNNNKKQHAECPKCKCAISFDFETLESDFAHLQGNKYKYFGTDKTMLMADPGRINHWIDYSTGNLKCPYCTYTLKRGDVVKVITFPDDVVYRDPIVAGNVNTGGGNFVGRDLIR